MMGIEHIINGIQSTFVFIMVLSVLVVVHEWGHFITAKKLGVRVDEFAVGFGPTLFSRMYHGTNYLIKALPLGGYVKMAGDERDKCTGSPDEFYSKSPGHRALIVFNGPVVNFVMAYLTFILVFMIGYPGVSTKIEGIKAGGAAQQAGILSGDEVIMVNETPIYGLMHFNRLMAGNRVEPIRLTIKRDGNISSYVLQPKIDSHKNLLGQMGPYRDLGIGFESNIIGGVADGYPAKDAGLKQGDRIVAIDEKPINDWPSLQSNIENSTNEQIIIQYVREGESRTVAITPISDFSKDESGQMKMTRKVGIGPQQHLTLYSFNALLSVRYAFEELAYITQLTYESLFRMVTGSISARKSVTGPVGIFYIVKGAAEEGLSHLLFIVGVISASLAIFNLLPVIPLDGGHLFLLGLEKVRGKALPQRVDDVIMKTGFSLIILLALFVFYSDFSRFGWIDKVVGLFH